MLKSCLRSIAFHSVLSRESISGKAIQFLSFIAGCRALKYIFTYLLTY